MGTRKQLWMPEIPPPSGEALLSGQSNLANPDLVKYPPPQFLVKCQAAAPTPAPAPDVAANFIPTRKRSILLPPAVVNFFPTTPIDTSAPTCFSKQQDLVMRGLANADPRRLVFYIVNPGTLLPDPVFKAAMIKRYRIVNDIAHEVLPGASVLKRFREELGESSERASVPKCFKEELGESSESASVLKRFREELGESSEGASVGQSSEGASVLKRSREELGESSETAFVLDPRMIPRAWRSETINDGGAASGDSY